MDTQTIIVYIIVALCVLFTIRGFIRTLKRKGGCSSCGKGCCCSAKNNKCATTGEDECHCNDKK